VLYANTLFPSPKREGRTRGGVILAKVRRTGDGEVTLTASWEDRSGAESSTSATVTFPDGGPERFAHSGVRKAVLLSRYADLLKSWAVDMRARDGRPRSEGIAVPPEDGGGKWEQESVPLSVSAAYADRFEAFADHFESEMQAIGDDRLERELDLLRTVAALDPEAASVAD
jgi:Ca-activated chloride channel family protein